MSVYNFSVGNLVVIIINIITIPFSSQHLYLLKCDIKMLLKVNQWLFTSLAMEGNYFFSSIQYAFENLVYTHIFINYWLWLYEGWTMLSTD